MARPEGLEPPALWFEARCSIQLSYGRILGNSIIFTLLRGYVKSWRRRNIWSIWSNISRNIEPNTYYFTLHGVAVRVLHPCANRVRTL
jgi:hypothetical protein